MFESGQALTEKNVLIFALKQISDMRIIKPPQALEVRSPSIFLAGSIELDKAILWQDEVGQALKDLSVTILNPRRDSWDASWPQDMSFAPFREQVEWELQALELADLILLYFDPATKSPISLLELGLHARSKKLGVCCPEGFWRKGNVDIVCHRYGIPMHKDLASLVQWAKTELATY